MALSSSSPIYCLNSGDKSPKEGVSPSQLPEPPALLVRLEVIPLSVPSHETEMIDKESADIAPIVFNNLFFLFYFLSYFTK